MVTDLQTFATPKPIRAAEYTRMSTEHQKYSTANQSNTNHAYAALRNIIIVRTYADEGISGLTFERRDALKRLIADVQSGNADFEAILVYDVSRWGRFQDPDESAYYEYICKRAKIKVHYCAEQFENDGTPFAAIVKSIKRAMAGEYSRELSVKTYAGQARLFKLGFRLGAAPAFGIRRLLVDEHGIAKGLLRHGEYKSIQTDRVVLVLGPPEEIKTVRLIFSLFVKRAKTEKQIVKILNTRGVSSGLGRRWTYARVRGLVRNEIYAGTDVWNRRSTTLGQKPVPNPPEAWLRRKCGFKAIIDPKLFARAQAIIRERRLPLTDEQKLEPIKQLLRKYGCLTARLINSSPGVFHVSSYTRWFGGLREVYRRVGYEDKFCSLSDDQLLAKLRELLKKRGTLTEEIINETPGMPHSTTYRNRFEGISQAYRLIGFKPRANSLRGKIDTTRQTSDDELLVSLRVLLRDRGRLSARIIRKSKRIPCITTYCRRFGSLPRAYELIGYSRQPSGRRPPHH